MPRAKRREGMHSMKCANCNGDFFSRRDDAQTCGDVCRQQLSREKRAARAAKDSMRSLRDKGKVECDSCGTKRDGRTVKCPVCGKVKKKPAGK